MTFGSPLFLLGLVLVPLLVVAFLLAQRRRRRYAVRFPGVGVLATLSPGRSWRRFVPLTLFALAVGGLVMALARPETTVAVPDEQASVVLVTDVSGSMRATDVNPTRLEAARRAAERFLDRVPEELQIGAVTFSNSAQALQTPTIDRDAVRAALASLTADGATATGAGLRAALDDLRTARPGGDGRRPPGAIVLLSDGEATDGDAGFVAAADARRLRIPVYTVALGTPDGTITLANGQRLRVPPDPEALERIARTSGGEAFSAEDADELDAVYERLGSQIGTREERREITAGFAGGALVLLAAASALSLRWFGRLP